MARSTLALTALSTRLCGTGFGFRRGVTPGNAGAALLEEEGGGVVMEGSKREVNVPEPSCPII